VANTVDPFTYPNDPRLNMNDTQRDEHFGQLVTVNGNRILVASGQNPASSTSITSTWAAATSRFRTARFRHAVQHLARSDGRLLPRQPRRRLGRTQPHESHLPLSADRFRRDRQPQWGAATTISTPESVRPTARILYLPESDTMILAQGLAGNWDWTAMNGYIEVYHGWTRAISTGRAPLSRSPARIRNRFAAAGNYLFVGYVHTVPNIDIYDLTTGKPRHHADECEPVQRGCGQRRRFDVRPARVSEFGGAIRDHKDNYNGTSVIVHRWTP
jgi:hypothetical protein